MTVTPCVEKNHSNKTSMEFCRWSCWLGGTEGLDSKPFEITATEPWEQLWLSLANARFRHKIACKLCSMPPQVFISPQASIRGSQTDSGGGGGGGGSGSVPGKRFCSRGSSGTKHRRSWPAQWKGGCEWGLSLSLNTACDLSHPERRSDKWLIPESPLACCPAIATRAPPPQLYSPPTIPLPWQPEGNLLQKQLNWIISSPCFWTVTFLPALVGQSRASVDEFSSGTEKIRWGGGRRRRLRGEILGDGRDVLFSSKQHQEGEFQMIQREHWREAEDLLSTHLRRWRCALCRWAWWWFMFHPVVC